MIQIALSDKEAEMLHEILNSYKSELRMEIAGTEQMDFREELKKREEFINDLIEKMEKQPSQTN